MKANPSYIAAVVASALFFVASPIIVAGDTPTDAEEALQQEEARLAVKAGLVRPLEEVLTEARKTINGDIVEIEFEKDDGRFIYEIEYVSRDGQLMEMKIDAKSLAVLENGQED
jgi:uncharacterized membrane protein YkoI